MKKMGEVFASAKIKNPSSRFFGDSKAPGILDAGDILRARKIITNFNFGSITLNSEFKVKMPIVENNPSSRNFGEEGTFVKWEGDIDYLEIS